MCVVLFSPPRSCDCDWLRYVLGITTINGIYISRFNQYKVSIRPSMSSLPLTEILMWMTTTDVGGECTSLQWQNLMQCEGHKEASLGQVVRGQTRDVLSHLSDTSLFGNVAQFYHRREPWTELNENNSWWLSSEQFVFKPPVWSGPASMKNESIAY